MSFAPRTAVRALPLAALCAALGGCPPGEVVTPDAGEGARACEAPRATPLRLLTRTEYDFTVRDLLGDDTAPARRVLPREPVVLHFDNNADIYQATADTVARLMDAAEDVAARAVAQRKSLLLSCAVEDSACGHAALARLGRRAFRRPLQADERLAFEGLFDTTLARDGFDTALEWTVAALLQSPQFLYRAELGEGAAATVPLTDFELASKLSYFLWASTPDDALLDAAEKGELTTEAGLSRQTQRLLDDPRAVDGLANAINLLLHVDAVSQAEKDVATYPGYSPQLSRAWRTSLELYVRDASKANGTLAHLLTSPTLYVDDAMSAYAPRPPGTTGFAAVAMLPSERVGLLTQPGLLASLSAPNQSSPVRRGIFVLERLMCQPPNPPPANAAVTPPPLNPTDTTRERFSQHAKDPACAGCHALFDPIGFGFECYDGMGLVRDTENGKPIDSSGAITWSRDEALKGEFFTVAQLAQRLAQSRQVHDCFASHLFRYALGRADGDEDRCSLGLAQQGFWESGGEFRTLRAAVVATGAFRTRAPPKELTP